MLGSKHGGRHELGRNFLHDTPTSNKLINPTSETTGPILEIGAGSGALTERLGGSTSAPSSCSSRRPRLAPTHGGAGLLGRIRES